MDPRRIKVHRSYTVEQLAHTLGCHKNAVRLWLKSGLKTLDDGRRPIMIQGGVAKSFLEKKRKARKRPCKSEELYCLRCREPRLPERRLATFEASSATAGLLVALCSECGTRIFKRVSVKALPDLERVLTVKVHEPQTTPKLAA